MEHAVIHDRVVGVEIIESACILGLINCLVWQELEIISNGHIEFVLLYVVFIDLDREAVLRTAKVILEVGLKIFFALKLFGLKKVCLIWQHLCVKDIIDVRCMVANQPYHRSLAIHTRLGKVDARWSKALGHARVVTLWIEIRLV